MPSFDVSSEMDWQELDNAVNQASKELLQRFDFKSVKTEIKLDQKAKTLTLWCAEEGKLEALIDVLQSKLVKRGISLHSLDRKRSPGRPASGRHLEREGQGNHRDDQRRQTQSPGSDPRRAGSRDRKKSR
jgi:uncharacterized protein YajQ (UPF0234 family)